MPASFLSKALEPRRCSGSSHLRIVHSGSPSPSPEPGTTQGPMRLVGSESDQWTGLAWLTAPKNGQDLCYQPHFPVEGMVQRRSVTCSQSHSKWGVLPGGNQPLCLCFPARLSPLNRWSSPCPLFTSVFTLCVSPVTGWPPRRVGLSFCPHGAPSVGRSQISTQGSQRGAGMRCKQERPLLSHAGWDGFSWMMGTAWAGLRGRAIVTCRSVILLPVTGSLLYTIKGLYSLRPLKSRVQGGLQEWLDWGIQHCLPGPIQLSPLLMSWQDVQYDPGLVTKGQTGQSKRTKIRSFTLDELSYLSIPGPVTGRGGVGILCLPSSIRACP